MGYDIKMWKVEHGRGKKRAGLNSIWECLVKHTNKLEYKENQCYTILREHICEITIWP